MKILKKLLILILLLGIVSGAVLFGMGYTRSKRELEELPLAETVEKYTKRESYVPFEEIDEDFVNAVIAVEDKRFFERKGYDVIALCRALYHNLLARDLVEGGSTISEQIAKNLYLDSKVTSLEDKMAEIFIMEKLETSYSKEFLFALYANMNYYGDGFWGIKQAAMGYFGKETDDLTLAEAAMLAGIPNAPAIYQLSTGYEKAKKRQEWVLSTMVRSGYISEEEKEAAVNEEIYPH